MAIRFLFGAGEAGAFPNAARVVTRWFPEQGTRHRPRRDHHHVANRRRDRTARGGAVDRARRLAADVRDLWRGRASSGPAFFYWWFRDEPSEHPGVNAGRAEASSASRRIDDGRTSVDSLGAGRRQSQCLADGPDQMVGATLFYMLFQWYPTYLKEARQLSEEYFRLVHDGRAQRRRDRLPFGWISFRSDHSPHQRTPLDAAIDRLLSCSGWRQRRCGACAICEQPLTATLLLCGRALFCLQVSIPDVVDASSPKSAAGTGRRCSA